MHFTLDQTGVLFLGHPVCSLRMCSKEIKFTVVDSCRIFSKTGSDTFRSVLVCGKEQESRKKIS